MKISKCFQVVAFGYPNKKPQQITRPGLWVLTIPDIDTGLPKFAFSLHLPMVAVVLSAA